MHKRAFERITTNLPARFYCDDMLFKGTVMNCSEKGMFIKSKITLPFDSAFEIIIPIKEKVYRIPVKIKRLIKTGYFYEAIGVEIITPPESYLELVNDLRIKSQSL